MAPGRETGGVIVVTNTHPIFSKTPHPKFCYPYMKETNLKKLSGSELDDFILYGIQQQQLVAPHSDDYQHYLNVVAAAKEEKVLRGSGERDTATRNANLADGVADTHTEDRNSPTQLHTAPKGDASATASNVVTPGSEGINQGIPGVVSGAAGDAPERTEDTADSDRLARESQTPSVGGTQKGATANPATAKGATGAKK